MADFFQQISQSNNLQESIAKALQESVQDVWSASTQDSKSKSESVQDTISKSLAQTISQTTTRSSSSSSSTSLTEKVLNEALAKKIMEGLTGILKDEEIEKFADDLLRPQLNAELQAAKQAYEATELGKRQEIENLSAALDRSIREQQGAYRQSMADVENAALARGMGRSSYALQTMANQGDVLSQVIRLLTDETTRQQDQILKQITQAAQQRAEQEGRLNTDFASRLAAKIQELKLEQREEYNKNYMTAISAAMGEKTTSHSSSSGSSTSTTMSQTMNDGYSRTYGVQTGESSTSNLGHNATTGQTSTTNAGITGTQQKTQTDSLKDWSPITTNVVDQMGYTGKNNTENSLQILGKKDDYDKLKSMF